MKKSISIVLSLVIICLCVSSIGCSRQPSDKRATNIMEKYFHKYSKKYPESMLGKFPVKNIHLLHIEEIHKHLVATYAILELDNNMAIQTRFTIKKKPFGWRAVSWENMGMASRKPNP